MAKYKSGHKRKSSDKFVTKIIIGFGVAFVVLVAALLIYNATKLKYEDFEHVTSFSEVLNQTEDKYLVYYYSESCGYCKQIKDEVLDFATENNGNLKVYLVDAYDVDGTTIPPFTGGTPTMALVEDGSITDSFTGAVQA